MVGVLCNRRQDAKSTTEKWKSLRPHNHQNLQVLSQSPSTFSPHSKLAPDTNLSLHLEDRSRSQSWLSASKSTRQGLRVCIGLPRRRLLIVACQRSQANISFFLPTGTRDFPKERRVSRREPRIPSPEKIGTRSRRHPPSTRESMWKFRTAQRRDQQTNKTFITVLARLS